MGRRKLLTYSGHLYHQVGLVAFYNWVGGRSSLGGNFSIGNARSESTERNSFGNKLLAFVFCVFQLCSKHFQLFFYWEKRTALRLSLADKYILA